MFGGLSTFTHIAYATLAGTLWYFCYLSVFGVITCALATNIVRGTGCRFQPLFCVMLILLIGQWWIVQRVINRLFFHFAGSLHKQMPLEDASATPSFLHGAKIQVGAA